MSGKRSRLCAAGLVALGAAFVALGIAWAKDKKAQLQKDLDDFTLDGDWTYDDIARGLRRAAKEDKPVLVVFR